MIQSLRKHVLTIFVVCVLTPTAAFAQISNDVTEYVPETKLPNLEDVKRQGFDGVLSIAANVNLADNQNVVGQTDGFSALFGLTLVGGLDYLYERHEIRNTLTITENFAKTPTIDSYVKNTDLAEFESLYNYFFLNWMGLFAKVAVRTTLFDTTQLTEKVENYEITKIDGTVESRATDSLAISTAFQPFTVGESLGVFFQPIESEPFVFTGRVGAGARSTFAKGVLTVSDDDTTDDVVEVTELDNVHQLGAEAFLGIRGKLYEKRVVYDFRVSALLPFVNNDDTGRSAVELMRYGAAATISSNVTDWMAINYQLRVLQDTQLLDELQVSNALFLTFKYDFVERDGGKAGPTPEEKLAAAEKQLADAEAKCAELQEAADEAKEAAVKEQAEQKAREAEEAAAKAEEAKKAAEAADKNAKDAQKGADAAKDAAEKPVEEQP